MQLQINGDGYSKKFSPLLIKSSYSKTFLLHFESLFLVDERQEQAWISNKLYLH